MAERSKAREIVDFALKLPVGVDREAYLREACGDDRGLVQEVRELLERDGGAGEEPLLGALGTEWEGIDTVEDIFVVANQLPAAEGDQYLDEVCGDDEELRRQVEEMLEEATTLGADGQAAAVPVVEGPGSLVGRFKILEKLGEGGFGVVYLAEQREPIERRVALKIIKVGMDTKEVVARFEAERQALARMDHPNIANVLDAGTTAAGRPYFVMELVKGIPVTEFCDQEKVSLRDRLLLFEQICGAIQHAHQKGVIHRDIKPSNILVALKEGEPVPKVIDFGIAKATQQRLTEKTLFTQGGQFIGTPIYASPEQAALTGLDIDTRSDVYSLGVLLYELLTGRPPFEARRLLSAGYDEMRRIIREEEPPKPSTRILSLEAEEVKTTADLRRTDTRQLGRVVRGDLDWIVMKALDKQRDRRYETANALAMDVRRFLANEPVSAAAPRVGYRVRKFVRRNKGPVMAGGVIVVLLVAGITVSTWQAVLATKAKGEADLALQAKDTALAEKDTALAEKSVALAEKEAARAAEGAAKNDALAEKHRAQLQVISGHMQQAAVARDFLEDPILSGHHYLRAALVAEEAEEGAWLSSALVGMEFLGAPESTFLHESLNEAKMLPGGERVLTWSFHGTVKIWPVDGGKPTATFEHRGHLLGVKVLPGGEQILTWSKDGTAKLWPTAGGEPIATFPQQTVVTPKVLGGGRQILTWGRKGTARIWPVGGGEPRAATFPHGGTYRAEVLADEEQILTLSQRGTAKIWPLTGGEATATFQHDQIRGAKVVDEGRQVLTWGWDMTAKIWPITGGEPNGTFEHQGRVVGAQLLGDGKQVLTWSWDGMAKIWPIEGGEPEATFAHPDPVYGAEVLPGEEWLLTWSHGGKAMLWPITIGDDRLFEPLTFEHAARIVGAKAVEGGKRILTWSEDGTAKLWASPEKPITFRHQDPVLGAELLADREQVLTWSDDGTAKIWPTKDREAIATFHPEGGIEGMRILPGGKHILAWSSGGTATVWPVTGGEPTAVFETAQKFSNRGSGRVFSDGKHILTLGNSLRWKIWSLADVESIVSIPPDVSRAKLLGDGRRILTWGRDGTAEVRLLTGGEPVATFPHDPYELGPEVLADGQQILTWSRDGTARLWPLAGGQSVATFSHRDLHGAKALGDGKWILTWSLDGTAKVWPSTGEKPLATIQHARAVQRAELLPDAEQMLTWGDDGIVKIWSLTGEERASVTFRHQGGLLGTEVLPGGTQVLTWGRDGTAKVWSLAGGEPITFQHDRHLRGEETLGIKYRLQVIGKRERILPRITGAKALAGGRQILTWSEHGGVKIWPIAGGEPLATFRHCGRLLGVEVMSGKRWILTWGEDGSAEVWDFSTGLDVAVEDQIRRYEVSTGTTLNASGQVRVLSAQEWEACVQKLDYNGMR